MDNWKNISHQPLPSSSDNWNNTSHKPIPSASIQTPDSPEQYPFTPDAAPIPSPLAQDLVTSPHNIPCSQFSPQSSALDQILSINEVSPYSNPDDIAQLSSANSDDIPPSTTLATLQSGHSHHSFHDYARNLHSSIRSADSLHSGSSSSSNRRGPKICVGDKVLVNRDTKIINKLGTVLYIGYPFGHNKGVQYGIALETADGDNAGTEVFDKKTGKKAAKKYWAQWQKRLRKRRFFTAKKKHGIFAEREEIELKVKGQEEQRFTINDRVKLDRLWGKGKGTIKFVGNFEGKEFKDTGVWYGIQLEQKRGIHNGTFKNVKYFECEQNYGWHCRAAFLRDPNAKDEDQRPQKLSPNDDRKGDDDQKEDEDPYDNSDVQGDDDEYDDEYEEEEALYAVKRISKAKLHHFEPRQRREFLTLLQREIFRLREIQQVKVDGIEPGAKYLINLEGIFEDKQYLWIVTNYCAGKGLNDYIEKTTSKDHCKYSEVEIQRIMSQLLSALQVLHQRNVGHLDLKPDNIMFDGEGNVQLIDFGMSRVIPKLVKQRLLVGTPHFMAPEVLQGHYGIPADIWSAGIILFYLRFGYVPFFDSAFGTAELTETQIDTIKKKILGGFQNVVQEGLGPWFPSKYPIDEQLMDLIARMLSGDPKNRLTATECLDHDFFKNNADSKQLPGGVLEALTKFNGQCRFKVMISQLFAHHIDPKDQRKLRECWDNFDENKDGKLKKDQFKNVMKEYDHGYREDQIEAMFESLDWNDVDEISYESLLTAYSYQRMVAVDERLWEVFSILDEDGDGRITKEEIHTAFIAVDPDHKLHLFGSEFVEKIKEIIGDADRDGNGIIDYEEFLLALHPQFNEGVVTPKGVNDGKMFKDKMVNKLPGILENGDSSRSIKEDD